VLSGNALSLKSGIYDEKGTKSLNI
jgi:hypothetical protein